MEGGLVPEYIFQKLRKMGLLAVVILFQPELRKLLEQVGSSKLGKVFSAHQSTPDELMAISTISKIEINEKFDNVYCICSMICSIVPHAP